MLDDENHLVTQFLTLWAMLDPISHLPLFLAATVDLSGQEKRRTAVLGVVFAFIILIFFGVAGELLLGDQPTAAKSPLDPEGDMLNIAIYPVATPIIAGPGSILAIILLTDNNRFTVSEQATTLGVLAVVLSLLLLIFLMSDMISRLIGRGGTNVIRRIMGIIIAAISVNLIVSALAHWLHLPPI